MARPKKMGMDYFPHDTDASSDEKIEALRSVYGNDGYAFFFILLERIYRTPDFELDISSPVIIKILSKKIGISAEKKILTSSGIKNRSGVVVENQKRGSHTHHGSHKF